VCVRVCYVRAWAPGPFVGEVGPGIWGEGLAQLNKNESKISPRIFISQKSNINIPMKTPLRNDIIGISPENPPRRDIEIPPRILRSSIIDICKTVHDPEIPVNIYDLGLIYEITVNEEGEAHILMTLTSPMCPVADILPEEVRAKAELVEGVSVATVELTFEPQWNMETHLSPAARLELNL